MGSREEEHFTMTEQHVKLLRASNVSWVSFRGEPEHCGAARIDTKRPYGNSHVLGDISRVLGEDYYDEALEDDVYPPGAEDRLWGLHRETEKALQVVLATGSFEPGDYAAPLYTGRWRRVLRVEASNG